MAEGVDGENEEYTRNINGLFHINLLETQLYQNIIIFLLKRNWLSNLCLRGGPCIFKCLVEFMFISIWIFILIDFNHKLFFFWIGFWIIIIVELFYLLIAVCSYQICERSKYFQKWVHLWNFNCSTILKLFRF